MQKNIINKAQSRKGTTLIEAILSLLIISLIASISAKFTDQWIMQVRELQYRNEMSALLRIARAKAVTARQITTLCHGTDSCDSSEFWSHNITAFVDTDSNGNKSPSEELIASLEIPELYHWKWANFRQTTYIQFEPDGTTRAHNGTLTLCRGDNARLQVVISLSGRLRQQKPRAGSRC